MILEFTELLGCKGAKVSSLRQIAFSQSFLARANKRFQAWLHTHIHHGVEEQQSHIYILFSSGVVVIKMKDLATRALAFAVDVVERGARGVPPGNHRPLPDRGWTSGMGTAL